MEVKNSQTREGTLLKHSIRTAAFEMVCRTETDGQTKGLFGSECRPALDAYQRSLIGTGWPGFWLEAPLGGTAGMDLHVAIGREQLHPGDRFAPGAGFGRQGLFDWYVRQEPGGRGLAMSHDLMGGDGEVPGLAVNINGSPLADPGAFYAAAGAPQMAEPVLGLIRKLPEGFCPWYLALMPNRPGTPGRVDCFLSRQWRECCADDPRKFYGVLERLGLSEPDPDMLASLKEIAEIPLEWELQMDVLEDGSLRPALTLSLITPVRGRTSAREYFSGNGPAASALERMERLGAADSRWRLIPNAAMAKLVQVPSEDGEPVQTVLSVLPKFLKFRWDQGKLQTAKVYFSGITQPMLPGGIA